jgi:hypothetical protein
MNRIRKSGIAVALIALSAATLATKAQADTTYSGFGYGAKVDTSLTGLVFFGHSGVLGSSGGAKSASTLDATLLGLIKAKVLHGSACAAHESVQAQSGVAGVHLFALLPYALDCDVVTAEARATNTSSWGRSQILNLRLGGLPITVTGAANQTVKIPGIATLVINEQKLVKSGDSKKMRVNALRLDVVGVGEIILGAAEADINYVPNSGHGHCIDFLSGCGRLVDGLGHIVDFSLGIGVNADLTLCAKVGCFANASTEIKILGCTKYRKSGNSRHCEGPCSINGKTGFTYILDCLDGGDTPNLDTCILHLSNGDSFSGHCSTGQIKLNIPCGSLALSL